MKKTLTRLLLLLCLTAILASFGGSAWADNKAELTSTQAFLAYLDEKDISYTYIGVDGKYEEVDVKMRLDNFPSLTCELYFKDDCEELSLRIWDIIKAKADEETVCTTLNTLNNDYKFVKLVYDSSDSTVQAEMDMYIDGETCGRSVYDAMYAMFNVVDKDETAEALHTLE